MCGRYVTVSKVEVFEEKFSASWQGSGLVSSVVFPGAIGPVITDTHPNLIQQMQFGYIPSWDKDGTKFLINARMEGKSNQNNEIDYSGGLGILQMKSFANAVRTRRCLVLADAFIEGTNKEKLKRPYLVYTEEPKRPIAFAGIYTERISKYNQKAMGSFAIITAPGNHLMRAIPHHRMPVILQDVNAWIGKDDEAAFEALKTPFPFEKMNAFPVLDKFRTPDQFQSKKDLQPIGEKIKSTEQWRMSESIRLQGMGFKRGYQSDLFTDEKQGD